MFIVPGYSRPRLFPFLGIVSASLLGIRNGKCLLRFPDARESIPYMFPHPYPKTDHGLHSYSSRHFPFKQTINVTAAIASMQKYTITDRHSANLTGLCVQA